MSNGIIKSPEPKNTESMIKLVYYTYKWTDSVASDAYLSIPASSFGISTPSGYKVAGLSRFTSGTNTCIVTAVNIHATNSTTALTLRNKSGSAKSGFTAGIGIMYIRSNFNS